jgi:hypothetical protein
LEIWYQRSAQHEWCLRKTYAYDIPETVARLKPEFGHGSRGPLNGPKTPLQFACLAGLGAMATAPVFTRLS